jgi:hypothetical protein
MWYIYYELDFGVKLYYAGFRHKVTWSHNELNLISNNDLMSVIEAIQCQCQSIFNNKPLFKQQLTKSIPLRVN